MVVDDSRGSGRSRPRGRQGTEVGRGDHPLHNALEPIMIRFGGADEQGIWVALRSSGGRERIAVALATIDAERARASVGSDRDIILAVV